MLKNYRGLTRVNMIEVREGDGSAMNPVRIVKYFTDDDGKLLGTENSDVEVSGNLDEE